MDNNYNINGEYTPRNVGGGIKHYYISVIDNKIMPNGDALFAAEPDIFANYAFFRTSRISVYDCYTETVISSNCFVYDYATGKYTFIKTDDYVRSVKLVNGKYVLIMDKSIAFTDNPMATWNTVDVSSVKPSDAQANIADIEYLNGKYVLMIVYYANSKYLYTSSDLETWEVGHVFDSTDYLTYFTNGAGRRLIFANSNGRAMYTDDLINFNACVDAVEGSGASRNIRALIYINGLFIGLNATTGLVYSYEGIIWHKSNLTSISESVSAITRVQYAHQTNTYMILLNSRRILVSGNGTDWVELNADEIFMSMRNKYLIHDASIPTVYTTYTGTDAPNKFTSLPEGINFIQGHKLYLR